jgi:hypothetical protein
MAFNTCNSAGCHKFHDNRALYEDFLAKHLTSPAMRARATLPSAQLPPLSPPSGPAIRSSAFRSKRRRPPMRRPS